VIFLGCEPPGVDAGEAWPTKAPVDGSVAPFALLRVRPCEVDDVRSPAGGDPRSMVRTASCGACLSREPVRRPSFADTFLARGAHDHDDDHAAQRARPRPGWTAYRSVVVVVVALFDEDDDLVDGRLGGVGGVRGGRDGQRPG
jgi:hypothetical protein